MSLAVRPVASKEEWERFLTARAPNTFLQSWNWGALHSRLGEQVVHLGAYAEDRLVGVALAATVHARRGQFLFCPHGPLGLPAGAQEPEVCQVLLGALRTEARNLGSAFLRVSPLVPATAEWASFYRAEGFRPAPIHMHAETMWVLDVRPSEDVLLSAMRKTTRNLIHRAERDGVSVRITTDPRDLEAFAQLYTETAARENFVPFSREFLGAEFSAFHEDGQVCWVIAHYKEELIAAALIILSGAVGFYHHGASSRRYPNIPAAYLLHWRVIQELRRRGMTHYNFWGVAPAGVRHHPWVGLSLFKRGFGGAEMSYLHAQDLPLRPSYWLTAAFEYARRVCRGV